jgi:hypothetical protein
MKNAVILALLMGFCGTLYGQAGDNAFEVRNVSPRRVKISRYNLVAERLDTRQNLKHDLEIPERLFNMRVVRIDPWAFWFKNLSSVLLPTGLLSIEAGAFAQNQLASMDFPDTIRSIGQRSFWRNELTHVILPPKLLSIGTGAFEDNRLESVIIPPSVRSIGDWAFYNNHLSAVDIENGVRSIGSRAFANNRITSLILPDSLRTIGDDAFTGPGNNVMRVAIGHNVDLTVSSIDYGAFYACYRNEHGRRAGLYVKENGQWELAYYRLRK